MTDHEAAVAALLDIERWTQPIDIDMSGKPNHMAAPPERVARIHERVRAALAAAPLPEPPTLDDAISAARDFMAAPPLPSDTPADGLDVGVLARALHEAGFGCMRPRTAICDPSNPVYEDFHPAAAEAIAREYAALAPSSAEGEDER